MTHAQNTNFSARRLLILPFLPLLPGFLSRRVLLSDPAGQRQTSPEPAAGRLFRLLALRMAAIFAVGLAGVWPAHAASGPWQTGEAVHARLLSPVQATGDGLTVPLAVELRLEPGWKTYWRSPGDAGLPPRLSNAGSENLQDLSIAWPAPQRFTLQGLETFGYDGNLILPLAARVELPGAPLKVQAVLDVLACKDVCIPQTLPLSLRLPDGAAEPDDDVARAIAAFATRVPGPNGSQGLQVLAASMGGGMTRPTLDLEVQRLDGPFTAPDAFVETDPPLTFTAPDVTVRDGGRRAHLRLRFNEPNPPQLTGHPVTITLVDAGQAVEATLTVATASPAAAAGLSWPALLLTAVLGGLILNLMPCVLPVLSLKLLSVIRHSGDPDPVIRAGFLASSAGILVAFWGLAAGVLAIRGAGVAVGWGIQFQNPWFLLFMALVVTLFAANLWDLFSITLPGRVANAADQAARAADRHVLAGPFFSGMLATLLATPCSAPFLGTAIAFALARGPLEIFAVFTALAVGLSLPYLLVAAVPALARRLPRPGRWMLHLRKLMGVLLLLTAGWLLSVLAVASSLVTALGASGLLLLLLGSFFISSLVSVRVVLVGVLGLALMSLPLLPSARTGSAASPPPLPAAEAGVVWRPYSPQAIAEALAQGQTVFVDVTADWCLTCQVNKKLVLSQEPVAGRLREVVALRADWTRPDPEITAFLARFGRYAIPFNVVFGPAAPEGLPLPELLTDQAVLEALAHATATAPVSAR